MATITVKSRSGAQTIIDAQDGRSLMQLIRNAGFDEMLALCGGALACATCHVYVDQPFLTLLPAISQPEEDLLDCSDFRKSNSRLSCQIPFRPEMDGLSLEIGPEE